MKEADFQTHYSDFLLWQTRIKHLVEGGYKRRKSQNSWIRLLVGIRPRMWKGWTRNSSLSPRFYNTIWFLNTSPWLFILFILSYSTEIKNQRNIDMLDWPIQEKTTPTIIGWPMDKIQHGPSQPTSTYLVLKPFQILGFPWTHPASS